MTTTDACHGVPTGLAGLAHGEVTQGYKASKPHAERVARGQGEPDTGRLGKQSLTHPR